MYNIILDEKIYGENFIVTIPLNTLNITSLIVLLIFICFGSIYVWKIITKKKCLCKMCKNEYLITEKLSEGGFGEVIDLYIINKT